MKRIPKHGDTTLVGRYQERLHREGGMFVGSQRSRRIDNEKGEIPQQRKTEPPCVSFEYNVFKLYCVGCEGHQKYKATEQRYER